MRLTTLTRSRGRAVARESLGTNPLHCSAPLRPIFGVVHVGERDADVVINNAGLTVHAKLEAVTYDDFELVIGVNMWGMIYGRQDRADEPGSRGRGDRERHDAER